MTESPDPAMREEIVEILLAALRRQGHPEISRESLAACEDQRAAFLALLDDCRPLPVIRRLRDDVAAGRL